MLSIVLWYTFANAVAISGASLFSFVLDDSGDPAPYALPMTGAGVVAVVALLALAVAR